MIFVGEAVVLHEGEIMTPDDQPTAMVLLITAVAIVTAVISIAAVGLGFLVRIGWEAAGSLFG
jgi:hypothetical protein